MWPFAVALMLGGAPQGAAVPPSPDPPLEDLRAFPAAEACSQALAFNRRYREHIDGCRQLYPHTGTIALQHPERAYLDAAVEAADRLYYLWDCLAWAHDEGRSEASRRYWLGRLRRELGEAAYAHGAMPPCVPLHLLRRID